MWQFYLKYLFINLSQKRSKKKKTFTYFWLKIRKKEKKNYILTLDNQYIPIISFSKKIYSYKGALCTYKLRVFYLRLNFFN